MKYFLPVVVGCVVSLCAAHGQPQMHPKGSALPFVHQGPFVTTAGGGVLCINAKNALRSHDDGRTWSSTPLFAQEEKFSVRDERALLQSREGVIVAAWINEVERRAPQGWRWGGTDVSWKDFVLPMYVCRSLDGGKTWETPVKLSEPWCGCVHSLIQMRSGRLVLWGRRSSPSGVMPR